MANMNTQRKIANTEHPRSKFRVGQKVSRSMGCRAQGVVVRPADLPQEVAHQIWIRPAFRQPVIPVRYVDGTFGYEHPCHLQ